VPEDDAEGEKNPEAQEEDVNDLQIAWECFEVCRKLYEAKINELRSDRSSSESTTLAHGIPHHELQIALSNVYIRLGDLQIINNKFAQALDDYGKALALRQGICAAYDRMLSDVYYSMALAYVYSCSNSNQSEETQPGEEQTQAQPLDRAQVLEYKQKALDCYHQAKVVMEAWIAHKMRVQPDATEEIRKQRELIEDLDENIVALREEVDAELKGEGSSKAQPALATSTTTIGFGFGSSSSSSSSSSAAGAMSTNEYFMSLAASSSTASSSAAAPVVNTLQPKKKEKSTATASSNPLVRPANENLPDNDALPMKKAKLDSDSSN
jgi:tetratricopeptide (TPR) repeat protein